MMHREGHRGAYAECEAMGCGLSRSQRPLSPLTSSHSAPEMFVMVGMGVGVWGEGSSAISSCLNSCGGLPLFRLLTGNEDF